MGRLPRGIWLAALAPVGLVYWLTRSPEAPPPAPPVPRLAQDGGGALKRTDTLDLLDWGRRPTPMVLVDVPRDALPNGLALTMLPFPVDWGAARLEGPDPQVLVRNLSVGGNPAAGENLLATARVPLYGISGVEWCLTPTRSPDARVSVPMTGLLGGDAMARRTLSAMAKDGSLRIPNPQELTVFAQEDATHIRAAFSTESLPEYPLTDLMGKADLSYRLLERSCITQSLAAIQLALIRLHKLHDLGSVPRMAIAPKDLPPWVEDLATADTGKLLGCLPGAVRHVARNRRAIPGPGLSDTGGRRAAA